MPLRKPDPFKDPTTNRRTDVNPYVEILRARGNERGLSAFYGPGLTERQGNWRNFFAERMDSEPAAVICEIGCYKGQTICDMAEDFPQIGFIGLDITFKRVANTATLAEKRGLKNVVSAMLNANHMPAIFADKELSGLNVFFPDPWSKKKRQRKNRLFTPEFCQSFMPLLEDNAFVWFKTDQQEYFEFAKSSIEHFGSFTNTNFLMQKSGYTSIFERLFESQGLATYAWHFAKQAVPRENNLSTESNFPYILPNRPTKLCYTNTLAQENRGK